MDLTKSYKEKGMEFDYYQKFSSTYQKPFYYCIPDYDKVNKKEMGFNSRMDYRVDLVPQPGPGNKYMMVRGSDHGNMGYGPGHNIYDAMSYGPAHNTHMQKPGFSGTGSSALGRVMGHEGYHGRGGYGMGAAYGCTTTYEKQHRRRKGGYRSDNDSDSGRDSSDDERRY